MLAIFALLEYAPRLGWVDRLTMVPFSEMLRALAKEVTQGELLSHLWVSGVSIMYSFVLACLGGVLMGYLIWRSPAIYRLVNPYLVSYYAVPVFAFFPVLVVIFGAGRTAIVLIGWGWAVVAVILPTIEGLNRIKRVWKKVGTIYHLSPWAFFKEVQAPGALPYVAGGFKLAATYSILGVILSEFIMSSQGLGWLVAHHFNNFGLAQMWAAVLAIAILAISLNVATGKLFSRREVGLW